MSSVECLREFVNERLTAAAEEIFRVFKQTVVEYEEEIDRQRRLLDIIWKPELKLHRIELPQQHVCTEEEVLTDQQLCDHERNSSLDQEEPEPPQIIKEQEEPEPPLVKEEPVISQQGEQLVLKKETNTFMWTSLYEESDLSEDQTLNFNHDKTHSAAKKNSVVNASVASAFHAAENKDQKGGKHGDSGSTRNAEPEPQNQHHTSRHHRNNANNTARSKIRCNIHAGKKSFKCDTCGKACKYNSQLYRHMRSHTGERPYSCNTCGKTFGDIYSLKYHMTVHTGERPHLCKICGKSFRLNYVMKRHLIIHSGEKPHPCNICGKRFSRMSNVRRHLRIHTEGKLYT